MSDIAIRVENLGKAYRITHNQAHGRYKTLQEDVIGLLKRPFSGNRGTSSTEEFWALKDISFEVKQGEVLGIIGRNGAGKSTLLKILSRITRPTTGYAEMTGRVGSLLEVGTGFHPELSGRENIFLNGAVLGMSRRDIQRQFDEIVAFAEVEQFLDTPVKRYSSGMYMRLAFAVAAHLEPEILIVDEVLAVGDAEFQKKSLGKMGEVAKSGRTVLFVSHNMGAVEQLCNRAILLNRGIVEVESNDVRVVVKQYLAGSTESKITSIWTNGGADYANPWFVPQRFVITDAAGCPLDMPIQNDTEAWIQIEADISDLDPALTVGYALYTEDGLPLYWSYQTDTQEEKWPVLIRGRNILRSRLPQRLLNEGRYHAELIGGLHYRQWLFEPGKHAPSIQLEIRGGISDSPYFLTKRRGLLAPIIEWNSQA